MEEQEGMDQIRIKRLEVFAHHGVLEEENRLGQKFLVSVTMHVDTKVCGRSDELADSVNYAEVAALLCREAQEHTFRLLERLAEHLAERILLAYPQIDKVDLEIEKPWAPVHLPLETVSVEIHRGWHTVYLGIGSNIGDREANLRHAIALLEADARNQIAKVSSFRMTKPVGGVKQEDFLNGAVAMRTLRTPEELLEQIGSVERELKRVRTVHWGPRTMDVDILLYDQEIIGQEDLVIPHPEMCNRQFVLEPLAEIAPYAVHPVCRQTIRDLFRAVTS